MDGDDRFVPLIRPGHTPASSPPVFERIGVVGLGLIGGSLALAARQRWPSALVIGVDRKDVIERAVQLHAIDVAASDLTIISEVDLVVLAAPVTENLRLLVELPRHIDRPVVVTDVGSTKRDIVEAASRLPPRITFVGGHPLAGSTAAGIQGARADLFAGRPWLFTPLSASDSGHYPPGGEIESLARLFEFTKGLGAAPLAIDAARHDHLVAYISHMPQLLVSALMQVVGDAVGEEALSLSGRGLRDTTRLAASPAQIWTEICASNADEIGPAIDGVIAALKLLRDNLDDPQTIERVFEAARRWRGVLDADSRRST